MKSEDCGWEIRKHLPYLPSLPYPSVHPFVHHFLTQTLACHSFMKVSLPNLQGMFMAIKKQSVQNFGIILKNKMAVIMDIKMAISILLGERKNVNWTQVFYTWESKVTLR